MGKRISLLLAALIAAALTVVAVATARKVANPGAIAITSETGTFRVNQETFDFDSDTQITFNGSLTGAGALTIPRANVRFPDQFVDVDSPIGTFTFRIRITANNDATGGLNPLTGLTTLSTSLRIDIDPQGSAPPGFGGDCRITPINVALSTAKSGGVGYNTANGRVTVADHGFFVPGAQGCGSFFGTDYNGEINNAVGIPTSSTDAVITTTTSPIFQKAVNASFTATPSSGLEPLEVNFNAGASTAAAGVTSYRWDFDGNGTFDQTTTSPTTSFTYATPNVYQARLRVTDPDGDFDETTRTITVQARNPDLAIHKSHDGDFVASSPGAFTVDVTNVGTGPTEGAITVTDLVPASLDNPSASGDGWTCETTGQLVSCTHPGPVPEGGSLPPIELTSDVTGAAVPQVTNAADVSTPDDSNAANNHDEDTVSVLRPEPDVAIDKSHEGDFLRGRRGTYTLRVRNAGSQPTSDPIVVTDTLPAGLSFVSVFGLGWSCGEAGGTVQCTHPGPVPGGGELEQINVRVAVASNAPSLVVNNASVDTTGDENPDNDSDADPTTVLNLGVDLTIDKTHTGAFEIGTTETYRIVVRNIGTAGVAGPVVVTDTLPAGMTFVSASGSGWTCGADGQEVTCTRSASLQKNTAAPAITLRVAVGEQAEGEVVNVAGVNGASDLDLGNNVDEDPTQVRRLVPDLTIDKSHSGTFTAGQFGTYSLRVRNAGSDPTVGTTTVTDELPAQLAFSSASGSGWSCGASGQTVTCQRSAVVAAGQTAPAIALRVTPSRDAVPGVTNSATVSTPNDVNAANDTDSDPTTVRNPPRSTQTVTSVRGSVVYPGANGGDATFTINVTRGFLGAYSGTVSFNDPGANHRATGTVGAFMPVSRFGLNGARGEAVLGDGQQRMRWQVDDLSALNLGRDDIGVFTPSGYNHTATSTSGNITVLPKG